MLCNEKLKKQKWKDLWVPQSGLRKIKEMLTYYEWYDAVGELVYDETGFDIDYLPDENYRMNYEYGVSVVTMSEIVMSNNNLI